MRIDSFMSATSLANHPFRPRRVGIADGGGFGLTGELRDGFYDGLLFLGQEFRKHRQAEDLARQRLRHRQAWIRAETAKTLLPVKRYGIVDLRCDSPPLQMAP